MEATFLGKHAGGPPGQPNGTTSNRLHSLLTAAQKDGGAGSFASSSPSSSPPLPLTVAAAASSPSAADATKQTSPSLAAAAALPSAALNATTKQTSPTTTTTTSGSSTGAPPGVDKGTSAPVFTSAYLHPQSAAPLSVPLPPSTGAPYGGPNRAALPQHAAYSNSNHQMPGPQQHMPHHPQPYGSHPGPPGPGNHMRSMPPGGSLTSVIQMQQQQQQHLQYHGQPPPPQPYHQQPQYHHPNHHHAQQLPPQHSGHGPHASSMPSSVLQAMVQGRVTAGSHGNYPPGMGPGPTHNGAMMGTHPPGGGGPQGQRYPGHPAMNYPHASSYGGPGDDVDSSEDGSVLGHKRSARMDLTLLSVEERVEWKKAKARQYSVVARKKQMRQRAELQTKVETLSVFQTVIESAPDGVCVISPDVQAKIWFANNTLAEMLQIEAPLSAKNMVDRCLWEVVDPAGKAAVVVAIKQCMMTKGRHQRVRCMVRNPFPLRDPALTTLKVDLTIRYSNKGLVLFFRDDATLAAART